jgi:hypothetical protein
MLDQTCSTHMSATGNWRKNLLGSYTRVLQFARACGNQQAIIALKTIGSPPWNSLSKYPVFRKWEQAYQAKLVTAPRKLTFQSALRMLPPKERAEYAAADDFSFEHFWGLTMSGPETKVDLPALGTTFAIAIFIIQGQEDLTALPELAKPISTISRRRASNSSWCRVLDMNHQRQN